MARKKARPALPNQWLRQARQQKGWTQQEVADRIGAPLALNVTRWERGTTRPSAHYVQRLCQIFDKSAAELGLLVDEDGLQQQEGSATRHLWYVPLRRNPFFTGREDVLRHLHERLDSQQTLAITQSHALCGLGGIGKTHLALEYAYRHGPEYSAVFWIAAESVEAIHGSFEAIAGLLRLPEREEADLQKIVQAVQRWLGTHSRWLLIWDNLEEQTLLPRFLPPVHSGAVLITTRRQAQGTVASRMELPPLDEEESILFLLRRAKRLEPTASVEALSRLAQSCPVEYAAARELVERMGGLPLALDQVGAYVEETPCSLADYLHLYESRRAVLLRRRGDVVVDHPDSVATTWSLAFERVEQANSAAAELLCWCAFLAADAIPEEIFIGRSASQEERDGLMVVDAFAFNEAIRAASAYS
ncbi:MAG: helix-turn-helix domain-containing protein, partial [Ktedonobacteraceae bacterium]|nr:helix-turn-helix domain-containing protein [Ktedonobacteraceae bacterium]